MGQINLQIPQTGSPDSTEDPKVASDLSAIQAVINGNIDNNNISPSAGIQGSQLQSPITGVTFGGTLASVSGVGEIQSGYSLSGNQTVTLTLPTAGVYLLMCHGTGTQIEDFHTQIIQWNGNTSVAATYADLINANYNQTADNPPGHLTIAYVNGVGYAPGGSAARPSYNSGVNAAQVQLVADASITSWSYSLLRLAKNL